MCQLKDYKPDPFNTPIQKVFNLDGFSCEVFISVSSSYKFTHQLGPNVIITNFLINNFTLPDTAEG